MGALRRHAPWITGALLIIAAAAVAAALFTHSRSAAAPRAPIVAPSASPTPTPTPVVSGIPRPYADCLPDGATAGLGWSIYAWDSGKQTIEPWYPELADDIRNFAGSPLSVEVAWYCPPR